MGVHSCSSPTVWEPVRGAPCSPHSHQTQDRREGLCALLCSILRPAHPTISEDPQRGSVSRQYPASVSFAFLRRVRGGGHCFHCADEPTASHAGSGPRPSRGSSRLWRCEGPPQTRCLWERLPSEAVTEACSVLSRNISRLACEAQGRVQPRVFQNCLTLPMTG